MCSGVDILKLEQISLLYSASYFDLGGVEHCFGVAKHTKTPMATELCGKTSACFFNAIDSEK